MTREKRTIVGLDDIKTVIFECRQCKTRVSVIPDNIRIPHQCPQCNQQWGTDYSDSVSSPRSSVLKFCSALGQCRAQDSGGPFTILLEFESE